MKVLLIIMLLTLTGCQDEESDLMYLYKHSRGR